ncbi:MAG: tetratricopeptide repeat protein [Candidatus Helarchaeota archaeon]|nr:tetratricopeptide repeat protein [Candidatus Helarchaeota archaeon]
MEFEEKAKAAEMEGDYISAIKYYFQALELIKEMGLVEGLQFDTGNVLNRIANLYSEVGNFNSAIKYYIEASNYYLESEEPLTKIYRLVGECHSNIGACNLAMSNYEAAIDNFQQSVEKIQKAADLEEEILRKYVIERAVLNQALSALALINLNKLKDVSSLLDKASELSSRHKVTGIAIHITQFLKNIITKKYGEARILLQEKIEDATESLLFTSKLRAAIMGLILDLASKHIPEARILIEDKLLEEKGEVILTTKIYQDMLLHALSFANKEMPRGEQKEVLALIVGKIKKDDVIVSEIVPIASGSKVEVEFREEHYTKAAMIDSMAAERGEFIVGWFHTHPDLGLFLSPTDVINQLGYQALNNKAIAIVFDFTQMTLTTPGFSIFRLDDTSLGAASSYHSVRWRIKDASKEVFAENLSHFDKFITNLNEIILKNKQMDLTQLAKTLNRSESLLEEIIPQFISLRCLPNTQYDPNTKRISLREIA